MNYSDRLNAWHLELSIVADAIDHVLTGIEEPVGLSATAHVLRKNLLDAVERCPFPTDGEVAEYFPLPEGQGGQHDQAE